MTTLREWLTRLVDTFRPRRSDADLEEELRLHHELAVEDETRRDATSGDGRRAATLRTGGVSQVMDTLRDQRGLPWLDAAAHDLRYAIRTLRRSPGFAAVAILTLAVGIGANTAVFSVLNALVLQRLPIRNPDGLVGISGRSSRGTLVGTPIPVVGELSEAGPLIDVCGYNHGSATYPLAVDIGGSFTDAIVAHVTGGCFQTFGITPILGRTIEDGDAPLMTPGNRVAVISHRFWTRAFGADPQVVGRTLRTRGVTLRIIGVLPAGFGGLDIDEGDDLFVPYDTIYPAPNNRRPFATEILGRLRPGVTFDQAAAELTARWHALLEPTVTSALPANQRAMLLSARPRIEHMGTGRSEYRERYARPLALILGLTVLLLALACLHISGLLLARLTTRRTELAVRLALGGSRWRVGQQMLMEGLLLSLGGAVVAVPLSFVSVSLLAALIPVGPTGRMIGFEPDLRVLAATALVGFCTGVLMTALPIWTALSRSARLQIRPDRTVTGTPRRWSQGVLVAQVTLSVVLVVGAGLLVRSLYLLLHVNLGVRTANVLTVRVIPVPDGYQGVDNASYYPALLEKISSLPGVRSVGLTVGFPRTPGGLPTSIAFTSDPTGDLTAYPEVATAGFFRTLGIPLLAGRLPSWSDTSSGREVAVVSESLARDLMPAGPLTDLLERHVRFGRQDSQDVTIVGVVGNATRGDPRQIDPPVIYGPPLQSGRGPGLYPKLVVATRSQAPDVAAGIRRVVKEGGHEYAEEVAPLADVIARAPAPLRMSAGLAGAIGGLALLLALIGIYGALAYGVSCRTREIGVRVALGATPRVVAGMILREGLLLTFMGLAIGLPTSWLAVRVLRSLMFGISANDPVTLLVVIVLFLALACTAGLLPARRAATVDPAVTLRAE